ncbi:probable membrane-associated kinase regulator 1 [Phragmites australis]|uniref:probable membrane-associated kinase regulator 1 n=1 Tax=Phragmites australis TaxID=29695 RepID=UPI002D7967CA|nr:probable membrane-associated kinase regulator 1 [Phragmites australis]
MGRSRGSKDARAGDAGGVKSFPSPTSSSASSSEFEFTVTLSPASKQRSAAQLCPADELFYKGQLLPLQLSPRISMVRTLLLSSASTSSASASDSTSTSNSSRDSNGSTSSSFSADCATLLLPDSAASSSRPSSATEDDRRHLNHLAGTSSFAGLPPAKRTGKQYLSSFATRFSSVFHRGGAPAAKKPSRSLAKEVIKKYAKKVKPLYEKLSQIPKNQNKVNGGGGNNQPQPPAQQQQQGFKKPFTFSIRKKRGDDDHVVAAAVAAEVSGKYAHSNSFSGNLRFPRQKRCAASCPSSMRSSPSHSGLLTFGGAGGFGFPDVPAAAAVAGGIVGIGPVSLSTASSMEELQSAIEGAIAHCKNTMGGAVPVCTPRKAADEICAF